MENADAITNSQSNETIGEVNTGSNDPAIDSSNNNGTDNTDKSNDPITQDPTSSTSENGNNENAGASQSNETTYLGTFKTREDAEKGFKQSQAKITEQGNRIKELEAKLNQNESPKLPDINKEIETVKGKVYAEYNERLRGLGVKYSSYLPDDIQINTVDDIVANLPPQDASRFTAEFMRINNECNQKLKLAIDGVHQNANTKFEELKARDKERYQSNEVVFNAWYNPPKSIEELEQLVETVKKQTIENYIKEQAAANEDKQHKEKLNTASANSLSKTFGEGHIFTRKEIEKMTNKEFAKFEKVISEQVAKGLVK